MYIIALPFNQKEFDLLQMQPPQPSDNCIPGFRKSLV